MTVDEAKEILLSTSLSAEVREAVNVLLPDLIDYYTLPGEEWRDVIGANGIPKGEYRVSSLGRAMSFKGGKVKILKQVFDGKGYAYVGIHKDGAQKKIHVHALVAMAFIPNPENKSEVNHKNGNKSDNRVENLEWATASENRQHALKTGLMRSGCDRPDASLTAEQVREIRRDCIPNDKKFGITAFARKFNVSETVVFKVYYRETYKNVE